MIKFSVIIPLYNKKNFVLRAINSVLNQNYFNFELIIVNDGSTDNSFELVSSLIDYRIKIINKVNGGVSSARNVGIDIASNEWICFLDADDYWKSNHLEEIVYLLNNYPEGKIFSTLTLEKSRKGFRKVPNSFPDDFEGYIENYFYYAISATVFNSSSVCVNKYALISIDKFDTNLSQGEDLDVWFKLIFNYKAAIKSIPTVVYDLISENRAMHTFCSFEKHLLSKINTYRNESIQYLNEYIDFFILRNSVPYYFSENINNVIPLISCIRNRRKIKGMWKFVYFNKIYFFNLICYKLYKNIKSIKSIF